MDLRSQLQTTLGDAYTLERELGGGGMSRVFVAEEARLKRKVVIKVLSPELAQGISVERFEREIQTAASLQQANIVPVLTAGDTNGLPFFTMPFVEGESLRVRLARGPLATTEVIGILRDVSKALAYAHGRGFVHRDIKPDNVLLSGGTAVVTDFGIAKALSASRTAVASATLTQMGTSIGTPAYMAPEQAAGDPNVDHRADLYSLGCLAYELLAGQPPFANRTPQRMLAAHMGEAPKDIRDFRADIPGPLADLVMACLAKDANDRPQQAADIARVLESVTSGSGMQAVPSVLLGGAAMFRKALLVYAVAFVAVAILAKAAIVGIGLPDWVFPGSLIVMALGLPVVLWTGYVQRVTRRAMTMTPSYTPGGTAAIPQGGTIATMALKAAPKMSWQRTARGGMYALGAFVMIIGGFMVMRALGIGPAATLLGTGALKEKEPIVMTDFSVTNGDTSLARVVSFAVRTGLTQSPVLSIMPQTQVAGSLERMERPRNAHVDIALAQGIALREGAKAIVDGEVTTVGGGYVLALRLLSADSLRVLASFQASGDGPRGLIDAADKVARDLRAKAGESLRSVQNAVPLARARTASLEALRLYSEGTFANDVETDWRKSMRLLQQAVALDSTFAEGWRKLGVAMSNLGLPRAQFDSVARRAYRLRGRLPEGEQASLEAYYFGSGPGRDRAKAIAAYERAAPTIGNNNNLIIQLWYRREFARAESLSRADIAANPRLALSYRDLVWSTQFRGKQAAADSAIANMLRIFPGSTYPRQMVVEASFARGRLDEAQRQLDSARAVRDARDPSWVLVNSANLALLRGQLGKWRQFRALTVASDSAVGRKPSAVLQAAGEMGITAYVRGDAAKERKALEDALTRAPLRTLPDAERPDLQVAWYFAMAGLPERAKAILADFRATVRDTALLRASQPDQHNVMGMIALAERKPREAITEFRRGDSLPDGPANASAELLARSLGLAFDSANQPDSAIAQYEIYLRTPDPWRIAEDLDPRSLATVQERLGQLYEAKGNADRAAEHYRAFVELWKNADPELQPRVAEARRRLEKLAPVERTKR